LSARAVGAQQSSRCLYARDGKEGRLGGNVDNASHRARARRASHEHVTSRLALSWLFGRFRVPMRKTMLRELVALLVVTLVFAASAWSFPGELDPNFGTSGLTEVDISPGGGEKAMAVARQPDGKYVAA